MTDIATKTQGGASTGLGAAAIGTVVGFVALYVFLAHLGGWRVPLVSDDRTAFVVLAVIGMVMCRFGIQVIFNSTGWRNPGAFLGAAVGVLILIAFVMALLHQPMFLLANYRVGFVALGIAMLVKWGIASISMIYSFLAKEEVS